MEMIGWQKTGGIMVTEVKEKVYWKHKISVMDFVWECDDLAFYLFGAEDGAMHLIDYNYDYVDMLSDDIDGGVSLTEETLSVERWS